MTFWSCFSRSFISKSNFFLISGTNCSLKSYRRLAIFGSESLEAILAKLTPEIFPLELPYGTLGLVRPLADPDLFDARDFEERESLSSEMAPMLLLLRRDRPLLPL